MAYEGLAFGLDAILLCIIMHAQEVWIQSARALRAVRLSFSQSGECGNGILWYCYCFNRLQLWLLAQGLLQSVPSLQVSVAMPYYSIVMVSIGVSSVS